MPGGYTDSEGARELDPRSDFKVPAAKGLSSPLDTHFGFLMVFVDTGQKFACFLT